MRAPYASDPAASRGRRHPESESATRTAFQRDRDRIIHSGAFRKLKYKTQVFVYHEGDYYRTRLTHSLEVAQIARSVSRALGLDEDLAEAVALAHDLGHTPFGHAGERALDAAMQPYGGFRHNDQTVRILTNLEKRYAEFDGLNLTWETVEGVVKHNGPVEAGDMGAVVRGLDAAWPLDLSSYASLEAQIANLSDDIAYTSHDIDDGFRAGFFTLEELRALPLIGPAVDAVDTAYPDLEPRRRIHEIIRRLVDRMVGDLMETTRARLAAAAPASAAEVRAAPHALAAFGDELVEHDKSLRAFLMRRMYRHYLVNRETSKARRIVQDLFSLLTQEPECLPPEWQEMLDGANEAERARVIADYIAGMTDRYAIGEHRRLFQLSATGGRIG